jgi:hypothetical protein
VTGDAKQRPAEIDALTAEGILKPGDVILTFRPEYEATMPYPHIQMGISHAGLIRSDGKTRNLDLPLDASYNGKLDSQLNAEHYLGFTHYHILRPRNFDATRAASFNAWSERFVSRAPAILEKGSLPFNSDYLTPRYAALHVSPAESVLRFRKILSGPDAGAPMTMYCSEFVWHFHSLAASGPPSQEPLAVTDVRPIFEPLPLVDPGPPVGLGEGPLEVLRSIRGTLEKDELEELIQEIFTERSSATLSRGHRATAEQVRPLMSVLRAYYEWTFAENGEGGTKIPSDPKAIVAALNGGMPPNYSPTTFLANTFLNKDDPKRRFDYVCTLAFVDAETHQAALKRAAEQRAGHDPKAPQ